MRFVSTRGACPAVGLAVALHEGLAPDGGLYFPQKVPVLDDAARAGLPGDHPAAVGAAIARLYVREIPPAELDLLVADAIDFPVPLVPVGDDVSVLELFHGPTLAFKDFGARFMARLLARLDDPSRGPLTILVATSGDTGSAVAQAFHGVAGTRVVVLYPHGQVSPTQEKQFTTLGGNVHALAVEGTFDDCQRLAKEAFRNAALRERVRLTSANSINLGRLIPQTFYYFVAAARRGPAAAPATFVVPSGNFGNLCAGLLAKRMGLASGRFLAATNANDVVPEYLRTGVLETRPSVRTISNAMDVGDPSNLERILHLYGGDLDALRADVAASAHDDDETRAAMREVFERFGYVFDPHTAVGWRALAAARERGDVDGPAVLLATAHPAKFGGEVARVLGEEPSLPPALAECLQKESRAVRVPPESARLEAVLLGGAEASAG